MGWEEKVSILVTGASGFIGSYLTRELASQGHTMVAVSRSIDERSLSCVSALRIDITKTEDLEQLPNDVDVVFHLAAYIPRDYADPKTAFTCLSANANGTLQILEWARHRSVQRFVYASSQVVYAHPRYLPVDEEHPTYPLGTTSFYGASKLLGEIFTRRYAESGWLRTIVLRLGSVYGAGMNRQHFLSRWMVQASRGIGLEVPVTYKRSADWVYIKDVVQAFVQACFSNAEGVYNIGGGREIAIEDLAATVVAVVQAASSRVVVPSVWPECSYRFYMDISKAQAALGYQVRYPLRAGLEDMFAEGKRTQIWNA